MTALLTALTQAPPDPNLWQQGLPYLGSLFIGVFGGGAIWGYLKDRRKSNAEGQVATATVELQIDASRMQNLETRFGLAQKAWDEERASFERRVAALETDLAGERLELEKKETKILELEQKLSAMRTQIDEMQTNIDEMKGSK